MPKVVTNEGPNIEHHSTIGIIGRGGFHSIAAINGMRKQYARLIECETRMREWTFLVRIR